MADLDKHIETEIDEDIARTVRILDQLSLVLPKAVDNDRIVLVPDQVELLQERVDWTKLNVLKLVGHIALLRAKIRDGGTNG
jgi:hypothetical protein